MEQSPAHVPFEKPKDDDDDSSPESASASKKRRGIFWAPLELPPAEKPEKLEKPSRTEAVEKIEKPVKSASQAEAPGAAEPAELTAGAGAAETVETSDIAEAATTEIEVPAEFLSGDEVRHAQQEIADDHLAAIESADAEEQAVLAPAADFLERVRDGADLETAFQEAAQQAGLDGELAREQPAAEPEPEPEPESVAEADPISDTKPEAPAAALPLSERPVSINEPERTPAPEAPAVSAAAETAPGAVASPEKSAVLPALPPRIERYYNRRAQAGQVLLAGIVGYLIGRRRGRITTERKLKPVQRKLEKQVAQLEQDMTYKEQQLTAAQARAAAAPNKAPESRQRQQPGRTETRLGLQKPERATRLGRLLVAAEAPTRHRPQPERAEKVSTMKRGELLAASERIIIEGTTLRKVYETNLISETQLRHLVSEHLRGKDILPALQREMLEKQIDFERDPMLRGRIHSYVEGEDNALGRLLQKAGVIDDSDASAAKQLATETRHAKDTPAAQKRARRQRNTADVVMITAIVFLVAVVLVLAFKR